MDQLAKQQACQLFIEQEIEKGLKAGKTTYKIGKEVVLDIAKFFEAKISPNTIKIRAIRIRKQLGTNVPTVSTPENQSEKEEKQDKQEVILRDDKGKFVEGTPMAPGPGRPPKTGADIIAKLKDDLEKAGVDFGEPEVGDKKEPVVGPTSVGLQYARMAINRLKEIPEDDVERYQAYDAVKNWIEEQKTKRR